MPRFLWIRWNKNGIPCAQRFKLFERSPYRKGQPVLTRGQKYVVLKANQGGRGRSFAELQVEIEADFDEAVKAFVDAEGGKFSEYWTEK